MCNVCGWLGWMLDAFHKIVTWGLGCLIVLMLCLGFLVTLTAGVAYGYNYSIAEFMHVARLELKRYSDARAVNPNIGEHFWWDRADDNERLHWLRKGRKEGGAPGSNSEKGAKQYLHEKRFPFGLSSRPDSLSYPEQIKPVDQKEEDNNELDVNMPRKYPPAMPATEVYLKDIFPSREKQADGKASEFETQPKISENEAPVESKVTDPFMFTNMKVIGEEESNGPTMKPDEGMKILRPFMLQNFDESKSVRTSPNAWSRNSEEGKLIKPFMLSNLKTGSEPESEPEASSKKVLSELPDYSAEYADEETAFKKPV